VLLLIKLEAKASVCLHFCFSPVDVGEGGTEGIGVGEEEGEGGQSAGGLGLTRIELAYTTEDGMSNS
jgi:hypothetical protein